MKIKVSFEKGDFDPMHDILFDLTGQSFKHNELEIFWYGIPEDIQASAIHWGLDDTVVRDKMYEYFENKFKEEGITKWED